MSTSVNKAVTDLCSAYKLNPEDLFLISQQESNYWESRNTTLCAIHGSTYNYVTSNISIDLDKILSGQGYNIFLKLSGDLYALSDLLLRDYAISDEIYTVLAAKGTDIEYNFDNNTINLVCDGNKLGSGLNAYPFTVSCDGNSIVSENGDTEEIKKSNLKVSESWLSTKCLIKGHMEQTANVEKDYEIESINFDENGNLSLTKRYRTLSSVGGGGVLNGKILSETQYPINSDSTKIEYKVQNDCYIGIELSIHGNTNDPTRTQIWLKEEESGEMSLLNSLDAQQVFDNIEYINYQVPGFPVKSGTTVVIKRQDDTSFPYHIDYPSSITFREYALKGCLVNSELSNYIRKDEYSFNHELTGVADHCIQVISKIFFDKDKKYIEQKTISDVTDSKSGLMTPEQRNKLQDIENGANNYVLPVADSSKLGGIKTGYVKNDENHPVKLDDNNRAYVTISKSEMIDSIYPVNSIFITLDTRNPFTIFGVGEWERISTGMCLWGSDEDMTDVGKTKSAGLPNFTGTASGLKCASAGEHSHTYYHYYNSSSTAGGGVTSGFGPASYSTSTDGSHTHNITGKLSITGDTIYGKSDTVQPPAFVVNIWKRTK